MHLKQKRYSVAVLLVYTITNLTFASGGRGPVLQPAHLTLHYVRRRVLTSESITTHHAPGQGGRQRRHLEPRLGQESTHLHQNLHQVKEKELEPVEPSVGSGSPTEQIQAAGGGGRRSSGCVSGQVQPVSYGKVYGGVHQETSPSDPGPGPTAPVQTGEMEVRGQHVSWQKLQPVVECGDKSMTVLIRRRWAAQLLLRRVNESSVPLSRLPPQCGYSVETSRRELSLKAQYDGCHVTQEGDGYVLPLLWRGSPVQMFCPVSRVQSESVGMPSVCCSPYGLTVILQEASATEEPRINVRGEWTPVAVLAEQCGYTLDRRGAEIVITAPFMTCGITVKDGKYTISLQTEAMAFTLTCPFSPTQLQQAHQPVTSSPYHLTRGQNDHMPKSPEPFRWGPPFYLAPPHYPHPTHTRKYPNPDGHDANSAHTTFVHLDPQPQPDNPGHFQKLPAVEYFSVHDALSSAEELKDSTEVFTQRQPQQQSAVARVSEKHTTTDPPTSASDSTVQIEAPPSHPFNPYYHYYHHPKIPLKGPPQDPDPGPHETASVLSSNPDSAVTSPNVQQYEAHSRVLSDQLDQPLAPAHPYPRPSKPHAPQPYPHHYFYYFPHYAVSDVKSSPSVTESNLNEQNIKYSSPVHPFLHHLVAAENENYNLNPHMGHSSPDGASDLHKRSPEWIKHPLRLDSEDDKTRQSGPVKPEHPEYPPMDPYIFSHNPYDYYFGGHYGSQASFKGAADPPTHYPSNSKPPPAPHDDRRQTATPVAHTELTDEADISKENLHYYHLLLHLPHMSINQQPRPAVSMSSGNEAAKSGSGLFSNYYDSGVDWFGHAAEHEDAGLLQTLYIPQVFTQLPYDLFKHHGEDLEMHHGLETEDHLKANMYTPSASPCGLGTVSDFECSISLGCCTYPVKSCTMGEYFVFLLPDYVVEPKVVLPAGPSEVSKDICRLQRMTFDPDFYIVSLEGCGVNKHVLGQTVLYLLEIQGRLSVQELGSAHDSSYVRLMVQCVSSPGCPDEVMVHVLGPSSFVQPTSGTGRLRIATDESFTSFFPQAHLPFSSIQGRPLYLELSLLDPPDPDLRLQVHYCLAYTLPPYSSWELIYDGCPRHGASQLLPSPLPHHIQRIMISSFLSLPTQSPLSVGDLKDPAIYFWCFTEVCSAADDGCTTDCINGPNSGV